MQEERGLSLPEQLRQIREYAEREDIEVLEEYSEAASAYQKKARRPEFLRMLQRAKDDPEVTTVLVHDFSRFSRDSMNCRILIRQLREGGVEVVSVSDPMFDPESVTGVYMEAITFAKNEAYSKEVAFHTRKGCRANVQTRDPEMGWCYKNGGQPLWGYRSARLDRGGRRGKPILKSIWVLDDTLVAGRPLYEWVRETLALAAEGATLDELRDFCNRKGIKAPRKQYWGQSTMFALLQPHVLLKYAGFDVWNVHRKNGSKRPPSEWVIVERAHEPVISEELASRIRAARERAGQFGFRPRQSRSVNSPYLLTGGLFVCGRCGANMIGYKTASGTYYVCGSQPYRRGMGCGSGVYVPKDYIEGEVLAGVQEIIRARLDPEQFSHRVNQEADRLWEAEHGKQPDLGRQIAEIEKKVANLRKALEDGLSDATWANERLNELSRERGALVHPESAPARPPKLDSQAVTRYLANLSKMLEYASVRERKDLMQMMVEKIELAPERRSVEIVYRAPEPVMNKVVAGVGFEPTTFGL